MVKSYYFIYGIYIIFVILTSLYETKKYNKNVPYKIVKKEEDYSSRIILGILAGIHYSHFIGTYNHKKYNTQVFTPETLECYVGGGLAGLFYFGYPVVSWYLFKAFGLIGFSILLVPIILNLISILKDKKMIK